MKLIALPMTLQDGRVMNFHAVHEVFIPPDAQSITVTLGSWTQTPLGAAVFSPEAKMNIVFAVTQPIEDQIATLLERVAELPVWREGTVIEAE